MTSSPSIWQLLHTVKLKVKILSVSMAFSENVNLKAALDFYSKLWKYAESGINVDEGILKLWLHD